MWHFIQPLCAAVLGIAVSIFGLLYTVHLWPAPPVWGRVASAAPQVLNVMLITRTGLWDWVPGPAGEAHLTGRALARAQARMHDAAAAPARIEQAKRRAEQVLGAWFERQGWQARIRWQ